MIGLEALPVFTCTYKEVYLRVIRLIRSALDNPNLLASSSSWVCCDLRY